MPLTITRQRLLLVRSVASLLSGALVACNDITPVTQPSGSEAHRPLQDNSGAKDRITITAVGPRIIGFRSDSAATGINERGQVVGNSNVGAFLWSNGSPTILLGLGGSSTEARAINDKGQVVGLALTDEQFTRRHAVLWEDGVPLDLGTLGARESYATSINDAGTIIGELVISNKGRQVFVWQNGVMTNVGLMVGASNSRAIGINSRGQVLIEGNIESRPPFWIWENGSVRDVGAFPAIAINEPGQVLGISSIWDDGVETEIPDLGGSSPFGGPALIAHAFNDRGQVVGQAYLASGEPHAFLWTKDGGTTDLGTLEGDFASQALAINNRGDIVGISSGVQGIRAFLWRAGVMIDLGGLPGQDFSKAQLINQQGEIAGFSNGFAVLWRLRSDPGLDQRP